MQKQWGIVCGLFREMRGSMLWDLVKSLLIVLMTGIIQMLHSGKSDYLVLSIIGFFAFILMVISSFLSRHRRSAYSGSDTLQIHYAGYGLGFDQYYDVTEKVRQEIVSNRIKVQIENDLFGIDPYPNIQPGKQLLVIYSHGTHRGKDVIIKEHNWLVLP